MTPLRDDAFHDRLRRLFLEDTLGGGTDLSSLFGEASPEVDTKRFGPYLLLDVIGEGASSRVYRALHVELLKPAAVKIFRDPGASGLEVGRIRREGTVGASLIHPGIVRIEDMGEVEGAFYLAMEYIDGRPLGEWLENHLPNEERRLDIARQITEALACAHGEGVIHRDLKPENILVTDSGRAVIIDFGLAKRECAPTLTDHGARLGTPLYMSPEQVEGKCADLDTRSDVFSLGSVLYEVFYGRAAHGGETLAEVYRNVRERIPSRTEPSHGSVVPDMAAVIFHCLEKDPRDRYEDARAALADIDRVIRGESPVVRPRGAWRAGVGRLKRGLRRYPRAVTVGLALAIVVAIVFVTWRSDRDPTRALLEEEIDYAELGTRLGGILDDAEAARQSGRTDEVRPALLIEAERRLSDDALTPAIRAGYRSWLLFLLKDGRHDDVLADALSLHPDDPFLHLFELRKALYRCAETMPWPEFRADPYSGASGVRFLEGRRAPDAENRRAARVALNAISRGWRDDVSRVGLDWLDRLVRAYEAYAVGDDVLTTRLLEAVGERTDLPIEAHVLATVSWARRGDFDTSVAWAVRLWRRRPRGVLARINLAQALRVRALDALSHGRAAGPDLERARGLFEGIPDTQAQRAEVDLLRALVALDQGQPAGDLLRHAVSEYDEVAKAPRTAFFHLNHALALSQWARVSEQPGPLIERALDAVHEAERLAPDSLLALSARLNYQLERWRCHGEPAGAEAWAKWDEAWARLVHGRSPSARAVDLKARSLSLRGDLAARSGADPVPFYRRAVALIHEALARNPRFDDLIALDISVRIKLGMRNPADREFQALLPNLTATLRRLVARARRFSPSVEPIAETLRRIAETQESDATPLEPVARAARALWALAVEIHGESSERLESWGRAANRVAYMTGDEVAVRKAVSIWNRLSRTHVTSPAGPLGLFEMLTFDYVRQEGRGDVALAQLAECVHEAQRRARDDVWVWLAQARFAILDSRPEDARELVERIRGRGTPSPLMAAGLAGLDRILSGRR